ncbi:MAG: DegT/DnrJ/EryC1/StrS family aminotransferase [Nitrospira sp.]|nr:DegT/DnrJ/EryC1/StrS family aminotransferase [Candidatus Manganitrophaceae bacterium]HIL34795.1 DegT/DnrJ/EryC1/StrS family aminotransferase [Candidatus Manganitrophaceae bacterium]
MKVSLLDLKAHHEPIRKELLAAIDAVFQSQAFILGPAVKRLEEQIATYCQTGHAVGVASGTDALLISLMAAGVGPGDEVITTPYSFIATAGAIVRLGALPVFVDIDPVTYNINPEKIEPVVTSKTKAIIPVHLYGQVADMTPILKIAEAHHLMVIEDAAQAIGAEYHDGRRAGSLGDFGCFSFFPSKNLGALGDAGMVVMRDPELAEKVRILRVHGGKPKYVHNIIGGNFRIDSIQAAVINVKLNYLDRWTAQRQENALRYATLFDKSRLIEEKGLSLPETVYEAKGVMHYHIYNQFVIRVPQRDRLREYLREKEITTEVYYPIPFHLQGCFQFLGYKEGDFPEAERAANETLALPIYPELTPKMQEAVVEEIQAFFRKA